MALDEPGALAGLDDQEQQEQQPSSPLVKQEPNADADAPDDAGVLVGLEEAAASEAGLKRGRDSDTGANKELEEPCSKRSNGLKEEVEEQQQDAHEADQAAEEPDITSVPNDLNGMEAPATAFVPAAGGPGSSGAQQPGLALVDGALAQDAAAGTALVTHHTTLAHEDGSVSAVLSVGKHLVGKLIGKAGATISSLQTSTGTSIQVDQEGTELGADVKKVTVRGSAEAVERARNAIKSALEEVPAPAEGEAEEVMPCPAMLVGRIIGRSGETIRSLQQGSGAYILVDQNYPEGVDRMVHIKGPPESVRRAASMLRDLISGEPGTASQIIARHGMGNTTALTIPRSVVGRIIGRGGETIKMLQRKYQVSIQIDQSCDPMNVTVTGPKPGADLCRQEVMALASDMPGPGFGAPAAARPSFAAPFAGAGYGMPAAAFGAAPFGAAPFGTAGYGAFPAQAGYGGLAAGMQGMAAGMAGMGAMAAGMGGMGGGMAGMSAGGMSGAGMGAAGIQGMSGAGGGMSAGMASMLGGMQGMGGGMAGMGGAGGMGALASAAAGVGGAGGGLAGIGGAGGMGAASGLGAAAALGGMAAYGGMGGAATVSVWQPMQDDQGRTYYYNTQTGVSQWEKPAEMP